MPPWYGNFRNGHFEHGRIKFLSCIYWVNILRNFGIFLGELVYLFRNFGILALKNSGNPAFNQMKLTAKGAFTLARFRGRFRTKLAC